MQVCKTDMITVKFSDKIDAMVIIRSSSDKPWDDVQEDAAVKAHDWIGTFLASCSVHKEEVYNLLKSLKE